jgi:hypothetical protein
MLPIDPASEAELVTTIPPSPVVITFVAKNEYAAARPKFPAATPPMQLP